MDSGTEVKVKGFEALSGEELAELITFKSSVVYRIIEKVSREQEEDQSKIIRKAAKISTLTENLQYMIGSLEGFNKAFRLILDFPDHSRYEVKKREKANAKKKITTNNNFIN